MCLLINYLVYLLNKTALFFSFFMVRKKDSASNHSDRQRCSRNIYSISKDENMRHIFFSIIAKGHVTIPTLPLLRTLSMFYWKVRPFVRLLCYLNTQLPPSHHLRAVGAAFSDKDSLLLLSLLMVLKFPLHQETYALLSANSVSTSSVKKTLLGVPLCG